MDSASNQRPEGAVEMPEVAALEPGQIARRSGSSFLVSFSALAPDRAAALTAIYAFCRVVDDAVDDAIDATTAAAELAFWRDELERAAAGAPRSAVGHALREAVHELGVQPRWLHNVVDGVAADLQPVDLATVAELERYCFLVAGSVGLACLPVFGVSEQEGERYAIELGHALQLTNVLRDLATDARLGRVYAPLDLRQRHGVEADWLAGGGPADVYVAGGPVARLATDLAERAEARFAAAASAATGPPDLQNQLLPAEIMGAVYHELLVRLAKRGGSICVSPRVRVPRWRKLWIATAARRRARSSR
ncbi:MAG: squalene/phytoene synthase family protein [Planctomycetota bacterium]